LTGLGSFAESGDFTAVLLAAVASPPPVTRNPAHGRPLAKFEFKTTLHVPTSAVRSIRFAPDGQSLIAACEDGKIQIWRAPVRTP